MKNIFPFLNWIKEVDRNTLRIDFFAGITGAVVVLPQGVAFALIAGMPPIHGLYTAMILPIVAALFGSSRHLISGPTTAISIVVFSAVSPFADPATPEFVQIALVVTFVSGLIQLALGMARLGRLVNFVSHSVVVGFTAGAALLIAVSQLKYVFAIEVTRGASFGKTLYEISSKIGETNWFVFGVGIFTLIIAVIIKKWNSKLPFMLIGMVVGSGLASILGYDHGISTVGKLPQGLPPLSLPNLQIDNLVPIIENSFAIALLGLIEAVAIGRSIATKSGQKIDGNQEFIGQGLSNIIGSFFSCYAGSGSFTRSGVNYTAGAKTPMSAIFAATILIFVVLFVGPLAEFLPISVMGGIILLVAYNLIDFHSIKKIMQTSKWETAVLAITFFSTLMLELEYAIYIGIIFSLIFYLMRIAQPRVIPLVPVEAEGIRTFKKCDELHSIKACPQLMIYRIEGSLFFGSIESVAGKMANLYEREENHLLIIGSNINLIDLSGAEFLVTEVGKWRKKGKYIYFCGFPLETMNYLKKGGFWEEIGEVNFFEQKKDAIREIYKRLDKSICAGCNVRIFDEC